MGSIPAESGSATSRAWYSRDRHHWKWQSIDFPVSSLTASGALNQSLLCVHGIFPAFQTGAGLMNKSTTFVLLVLLTVLHRRRSQLVENWRPSGLFLLRLVPAVSLMWNPASYRCAVDFGNWIYNAGLVEPAIAGCDPVTRIPTGTHHWFHN